MTITKDTFVSVMYELRNEENGEIVEKTSIEKPLEFILGQKQMLEHFELNLMNKNIGDKVSFMIPAVDAYGEVNPDMIVELPKEIFEGVEADDLKVGNVLPMMDSIGRRLQGKIITIADSGITMDFNSEMAGKDLYFNVEIINARPATEDEIAALHSHSCGGSCGSCNGGCHGEEGHDNCGCGGCH